MVITEYNNEWPAWFISIKKELCKYIKTYTSIEHVGSTAIQGMCAKPVIDIDIVIDTVHDFQKIKEELESAGYFHNGDQGIAGREAFNKNNRDDKILDAIRHNLYVCAKDSEELKRHILFRDYLNRHRDAMIEYYNIKQEIIGKYGNEDRKKYVSVKEEEYTWYFKKIISLAKASIDSADKPSL